MAKRRQNQGLNHLAGALKKIMTCGSAPGPFNHQQLRIMLKAAVLFGFIDKVFTAEQLAAANDGEISTAAPDDSLLAELREKFQGGVNANTPSA